MASSGNELALVGSGGHARVVFDSLGYGCLVTVYDEGSIDLSRWGAIAEGLVFKEFELPKINSSKEFHVAIGDNVVRKRLCETLLAHSLCLVSVVSSLAIVDFSGVSIGDGCFLAAGSLIASDSRIGVGTIINHNASVDHDCKVGDYCHIAPASTLCGGVLIEDGCLIGAGAVVLPGLKIGSKSVVGAGAVVVSDLPPNSCAKGVPAKATI